MSAEHHDMVWRNFVKEGFYSRYAIDATATKKSYKNTLTGNEARSAYESIISDESVHEQHLQESPLSASTKRSTNFEEKIEFNINTFLTAAQDNNTLTLEKMIASHPDIINCTDSFGWTALMCATQANCEEAVKFLIKKGADRNITDNNGRRALTLAIKAKHKRLAKILKFGIHDIKCSNEKRRVEATLNLFCDLCKEHIENMDVHLLSVVHNFNKTRQKSNTFYGLPETNKGFQLMLKTGWNKDVGLGPRGRGQKFPVKTALKMNTKGFGLEKLKTRVTHFKANDLSAIGNYKPTKIYRNKQRLIEDRIREKRLEKKFRNEFQ